MKTLKKQGFFVFRGRGRKALAEKRGLSKSCPAGNFSAGKICPPATPRLKNTFFYFTY